MTELLTFVEPGGVETELPTTRGLSGRFVPPVMLIDQPVPSSDGTRLRALRFDARNVIIPVWFESVSLDAHRELLRAWSRRLNPRRGGGKLRARTGAVMRELGVRFVAGLGDDESYPHFTEAKLLFHAADPYWYDVDYTVQTFGVGGVAEPFFALPDPTSGSFLTLATSTIALTQAVDNNGDVETWPLWTITGPAASVMVRNVSTGQELTIVVALLDGEVVTIDTRPGVKAITKNGVNRFDMLGSLSALWSLQPGVNVVQVELPLASAASAVRLSYAGRWLSP